MLLLKRLFSVCFVHAWQCITLLFTKHSLSKPTPDVRLKEFVIFSSSMWKHFMQLWLLTPKLWRMQMLFPGAFQVDGQPKGMVYVFQCHSYGGCRWNGPFLLQSWVSWRVYVFQCHNYGKEETKSRKVFGGTNKHATYRDSPNTPPPTKISLFMRWWHTPCHSLALSHVRHLNICSNYWKVVF